MVLEHGGECKRGGKCTKVQSCDVLIEGLCDCTYTRTEYSSMTYVLTSICASSSYPSAYQSSYLEPEAESRRACNKCGRSPRQQLQSARRVRVFHAGAQSTRLIGCFRGVCPRKHGNAIGPIDGLVEARFYEKNRCRIAQQCSREVSRCNAICSIDGLVEARFYEKN